MKLDFRLAALLLVSVFLCGLAVGQSNGFRPTLVQSNSIKLSPTATTMLFLDNVTAGDVLFIGSDSPSLLSFTDSVGTAYTNSGVFTLNDGSGTAAVQMACGIAPASGANTLTVSGQSGNFDITIAEFSGVGTCTTDGTNTANAPTVGPPASTVTTSTTTANSNDLCISYGANWWATSNMWSNGNTAGGDGSFGADFMDYRIAGAAGAQSITFHINLLSTSPGNAWLVRTQCYTPTFAITTDALPHGAQSVAYTAQLASAGGTGSTRTWSITAGSLPAGLSLNASTGAITGTPSGSVGTNAITFQVSDGTHTTTRALNLGIGAALATPSVVGHHAFGTNITYSATAGNLLVMGVWGQENSGAYIRTPKYNGVNNVITSTPALSFFRLTPIPGIPGNNVSNGSPFSLYAACVPTTASYNINTLVTDNQSLSPQFAALEQLVEVHGAQGTIDDGFSSQQAGFSGSPETVTVNATAPVANTLAIMYGTASGVNAPFTLIDNTASASILLLDAYDLVGSAGAFSGAVTFPCTTFCSDDAISAMVVPLRPDISGLTCGSNPAGGGGGASPVRHKAQVY